MDQLVILMIWTIVAASGDKGWMQPYYGWRPIGEFVGRQACFDAAKQMNLKINEKQGTAEFVCLDTGKKSPK